MRRVVICGLALLLSTGFAQAQSRSSSNRPARTSAFPELSAQGPGLALQAGAGVEASLSRLGDVSVLLRIDGALLSGSTLDECGNRTPDTLVLGHLRRGEVALDPLHPENVVPYAWVEFVPVSYDVATGPGHSHPNPSDPDRFHVALRMFPLGVHRDTRMGRQVRVNGALVGFEVAHIDPMFDGADVGVLAQLIVDLFGVAHELSTTNPLGDLGWHGGLMLGQASTRLGLRFRLNRRTTFALVGEAGGDVTFSYIGNAFQFCWAVDGNQCTAGQGNTMIDGWAGVGAHVLYKASSDVTVDSFAEVRTHQRIETARDLGDDSDTQLMTGVEVRF